MGTVISLADHRSQRPALGPPLRRPRAVFSFDLASPATYLAAERVDGLLPGITWRPALREALHPAGHDTLATALGRALVERRARELRLPLVWPEGAPTARAAMRVAAHAAECGRVAPFVLAASRLAYCGGFDLEDPEVLAEAAAAAGLGLEEALEAAGDDGRDGAMEAEGRRLLARGAACLPAVSIGRALFCGEERIGEAAGVLRATRPSRGAASRCG